jgi:hypothetical protein
MHIFNGPCCSRSSCAMPRAPTTAMVVLEAGFDNATAGLALPGLYRLHVCTTRNLERLNEKISTRRFADESSSSASSPPASPPFVPSLRRGADGAARALDDGASLRGLRGDDGVLGWHTGMAAISNGPACRLGGQHAQGVRPPDNQATGEVNFQLTLGTINPHTIYDNLSDARRPSSNGSSERRSRPTWAITCQITCHFDIQGRAGGTRTLTPGWPEADFKDDAMGSW